MITLEQVRLLDQKVNDAVELIDSLRTENRMLNDKLESYQNKISELEILLSSLKDGQSEVEIGFQKALETLSGIEEAEQAEDAPEETVQQEASSPAPESAAEEAVEEESDEEEQTGAELDIF